MSILLKNEMLFNKIMYVYKDCGADIIDGIGELEKKYAGSKKERKKWVCEKDIMLITYGDSIRRKGEIPLQTLKNFFDNKGQDTLSAIHLLPFYPFTSDDGFSVVDYLQT